MLKSIFNSVRPVKLALFILISHAVIAGTLTYTSTCYGYLCGLETLIYLIPLALLLIAISPFSLYCCSKALWQSRVKPTRLSLLYALAVVFATIDFIAVFLRMIVYSIFA
jgi:hypothetical protein